MSEELLPKAAFKGTAPSDKAGKLSLLIVTGDNWLVPALEIVSPHVWNEPSEVLTTVVCQLETKLSYSIVAALLFEAAPKLDKSVLGQPAIGVAHCASADWLNIKNTKNRAIVFCKFSPLFKLK